MLEVKGLNVEVGGKQVLKDINLNVEKDSVTVLFGPNGSGKSTLLRAITGSAGHKVLKGDIIFMGRSLKDMPMEERIRAGMGLMYQHPPKIRGVKLRQIAEYLTRDKKKIDDVARELSLEEHLDRDINLGFSGGEMKRAELFQLILQDPDLLLLDEPESGVDIENISLMGRTLRHFIEKEGKSLLVITHTGYILDHIRAAGACVLMDGVIWCDGSSPKEVFRSIQEEGYEKCKVCTERKKS